MEREFVPFEIAKKLRALGFDESCCAFYEEERVVTKPEMVDDKDQYRLSGWRTCKNSEVPTHYFAAATFSQAFGWFREKYQLEGEISKRYRWSANSPNPEETFYQWGIFDFTKGRKNYIIWLSGYDADKGEKACTSHEEAELACLTKLIEIIESK